uniref:NADH dehydrogenase subunit 5 n=1 Tax=Wormaldia unispina TaxID=2683984 RepID=UPI0022DCDA25|nr:NADH dehydrogenase subunit 5 [Wormaldia unispina]UZZ44462.1 NADH dehydrogenase subunit 5 [Wormaldia unispina]
MKFYICMMFSFYLFGFSLMFMNMGLNFINLNMIYIMEWEIISLNSMSVSMLLYLDWIALLFMGVVLLISSSVIFYSWSYMGADFNISRFILLVLLFVFSMMMMIVSPNLISILLGWDGLGLVSFCLVIYYQNSKSFNSGMLTVMSNRVGDVMLLMSIAWMLNYGSWNFLMYLDLFKNDKEMFIIGALIIMAAMTKSAQIPFSSWLPAAMAAPTPVSALVHSSTLVTAGVYLLIRFSELINSSFLSEVLLMVACLTMFMSGVAANFEFDLKKIIALSTLSQLGLMMSILGLGMKNLTFFHLLSHALFKSMLFMCAGLVIHNMKNIQDIRFMGNMIKFMPLVCINLNIGNLALCGFPFLAGFYSKDLILEKCLMVNLNWLIFFFFFFSTGLTVSYSVRLMYFNMLSDMNFYSLYLYNDNDNLMISSIMLMMILSVLGGSGLMWILFFNVNLIYLIGIFQYLILSVLLMGIIMGLMIFFYLSSLNYNNLVKFMYFVGKMWFLIDLSTIMISRLFLFVGVKLNKFNEYGWLEKLGGQGMYNLFMNYNFVMKSMNINFIKNYLISFFFWFMLILLISMKSF